MANGAPSGMTKAYLELIERSNVAAASSAAPGGGQKISFQFNPKEIQQTKKATWVSTPTSGSQQAPPPEYTGPEPTSMTLEMFLDASEKENGDVTPDVQKLFDACVPTASSEQKDKPLPPFVIFGWDKVYFKGYVESVNARYTLFRQDGKPVRALCTVTLKELPDEKAKQNPTSGALEAHRFTQVVAGDTLASIAYREQDDPNQWRAIAEANDIDDPLRVAPGTTLLIPSATKPGQD